MVLEEWPLLSEESLSLIFSTMAGMLAITGLDRSSHDNCLAYRLVLNASNAPPFHILWRGTLTASRIDIKRVLSRRLLQQYPMNDPRPGSLPAVLRRLCIPGHWRCSEVASRYLVSDWPGARLSQLCRRVHGYPADYLSHAKEPSGRRVGRASTKQSLFQMLGS